MAASLRFGSALSVLALATMIGGCASPGERVARSSNGGADKVAFAIRAQMALASQDYVSAVDFAERAVERTPRDAGLRALLGNAYFASGRFTSAEAAYRDSLALLANQPQVVLKLALVEIAQGRGEEAIGLLDAARGSIGASDYGLALALAGRPADAVSVLQSAAREPGADAQVRQNLALAHALSGDWISARLVAAQDLSADMVNVRVQQWMSLAKPGLESQQVAALVGVSPVASDPGQPVRIALRGDDAVRSAILQPPASPPAFEQAPAAQVAEAAPIAPVAVAAPAPVEVAAPAPVEVAAPAPVEVAEAVAPVSAPIATPAPAFEAPVAKPAALPAAKARPPIRRAALTRALGKSTAVVQLGAYASPQRVGAAWSQVSSRYAALQGYTPVSARFAGPKGTVYRLSVKGFASAREAQALCVSVKRAGGSCFVRNVAGDAPVQFASR